jgi:uncharacterized YccA/Bax inhibitor family protein
MSHEGVTLVMRAAMAIFLIIVGAFFRALAGEIMLVGGLGGMSLGVLFAYLMSPWFKTDESVIYACLGTTLGWGVSWWFARRIPREAN